jgi:undecaprenyl-diphosphatase
MARLTDLGGTTFVIVASIVIGVIEYRRRPSWAVPVFLFIALVGEKLLVNGMKLAIDRTRPDIDQLTTWAGSSFPSGHAATAAVCFAAFALLLGRGRSPEVRALLAGFAVGIAVFVAATRVFLGVHWFTDVLVGLTIGWVWFALCGIAFGGRFLLFGAPAIAASRSTT